MNEPVADVTPVEPQAPPPDDAVITGPPEPAPQVAVDPVDEEAALDAALDEQAIEIPDGDKLVPLSAVVNLREKVKTLKADAKETPALRQKLADLEAQMAQQAPLTEAARAILAAQQQVQPQQPAAPVEDTAELENVAKLFDFYKGDGSLDLDKARKYQAHVESVADRKAQAQTAPLVQETLQSRAQHNIARAKATVMPNGTKADPGVLQAMIDRVAQQPNGLQTLADPEQVKILYLVALGAANVSAAAQPPAPKVEAPPPPLFSEKAGGQAAPQKALDASEKKLAKDLGMSEAEYLKSAAKMPW